MTGAESGFLLLTCTLGNPERRALTTAQFRTLAHRVRQGDKPPQERELEAMDLIALGYGMDMAQRILALLSEQDLLEYYCRQARHQDCQVLTWVTEGYPARLKDKLGEDSPGCLLCKGDVLLLDKPKISLVGSRDLLEQNRSFAEEVGRQAALQGYVLVSGNARGADKTAQDACLKAGGQVISVVADSLADKSLRENVLYISEEGFDLPFTAQRAISRNRLIHALSAQTFVAQCGNQQGGTWDGTKKNLRHGWSHVYAYDDQSPASQLLQQMGAALILPEELQSISELPQQVSFLEEN